MLHGQRMIIRCFLLSLVLRCLASQQLGLCSFMVFFRMNQNKPILFLVDSGSSHSFVCTSLVEQLSGVIILGSSITAVKVADGAVWLALIIFLRLAVLSCAGLSVSS